MAHKVTVLDRQSIWDIAIQEHGSVEAVFAMLSDAGLTDGLDTQLVGGQLLDVKSAPFDATVYAHYKSNDIHPVTGDTIALLGDFSDDFSDDFFI